MFLVTLNIVWVFSYFFFNLYLLFIISIVLYLLPTIGGAFFYLKYRSAKTFEYILGFDLYPVLITPLFLNFLILFSWNSFTISSWFGHIIASPFQIKITYLILFIFWNVLNVYCSTIYISNKEIFDYLIVCFNFLFWIIFLFYSNTLFTVIFFIEIISTLIFLLLITSTFSTNYFYKNLNLNLHSYFSKSLPFFFLQSLLFFFWISLISSLNLFLFLFLFYLKFVTFEWNTVELVFLYLHSLDSFQHTITSLLIWFNLLFCIFLKCGLVPFYFWKPIFFKGLPNHVLLFYIVFFYFFIFLFFIYFLIFHFNEFFYSYIQINAILLIFGFGLIFCLLNEAVYIKTFLALSSILNTLFIFLALNGTNLIDFFF